ncbi:hypothetical protein BCR42DRAFT_423642, partial [Absidia repens]
KSIDLCWFNKNKCITHSKNKIKRGLIVKNKRGFYDPIETADKLVVKRTFVLSFI